METSDLSNIGSRIRKERRSKGLSQSELSFTCRGFIDNMRHFN